MVLVEMLKENKTLTELYLDYSGIGDEGAKELAEALLVNDTLTLLDLSGNEIGNEYTEVLRNLPRVKSGQLTLDILA